MLYFRDAEEKDSLLDCRTSDRVLVQQPESDEMNRMECIDSNSEGGATGERPLFYV